MSTKNGTKMQRIQAAAKLIRLAENVSRDVALAWAHQAYQEWHAKEARWAALEARAEHLRKFPAAAKPAKIGGIRIYGCPKPATQRAVERRQEAEAVLPPLLSAEESFRLYGAKPKQPEYVWVESPGCAAVNPGPRLMKFAELSPGEAKRIVA